MGKDTEPDYVAVLRFYKIKPTSIRLAVLKAIYSSAVEFDIQEVIDNLKPHRQNINRNSVTPVLRLYIGRGLLIRIQKNNQRDRAGRPVIRFLLSGKHISTIL